MKTKLTTYLSTLLLGAALVATSIPATASAADVKPYTLKTCVVSGNELGSMGKVVTKTYEGQEVKFCCKPCIKKFDANPAKYLSKLK
ncbi:YHS domain-containing protein [Roseimicrobium gellanilyticum]|uniref:YHS domain-containing protein n=1 Tax=Roseimicrobium gellanilyticum TaxID=748857 RepID=A0A366HNP7_9BACT|nr:YHS domain-containing protein [Roseimicrobium gellanilyticum]RBP44205.1 YHS domain-containing protein [Roseimicrobium gellanilyticum]